MDSERTDSEEQTGQVGVARHGGVSSREFAEALPTPALDPSGTEPVPITEQAEPPVAEAEVEDMTAEEMLDSGALTPALAPVLTGQVDPASMDTSKVLGKIDNAIMPEADREMARSLADARAARRAMDLPDEEPDSTSGSS